MLYEQMTREQLEALVARLSKEYEIYRAQGLKLNMTRGVPSEKQLDLSQRMAAIVDTKEDCMTEAGVDCRTYNAKLSFGLPELKKLFAEAYGLPEDYIIIGGNSSLNLEYDTISRLVLFGAPGGEPWYGKHVKFICPVPGYDRHFRILETLGIKMLNVDMLPDGPDMDAVEKLAADPDVRGMICVPKYSNPTGVVFSDETIRRMAAMKTAAPDFRIIWDNAYGLHNVYEDVPLCDVFSVCREYGTEDRVFYFASTSKMTFPGGGIAFMAVSEANHKWCEKLMNVQSIGSDKINQLRHVKFFKNAENVKKHMRHHADILRPKFDIVKKTFAKELGADGLADWGDPQGGYFFSLNVPDGCAKRVYKLMADAGVMLTAPGSTFPYGKDPRDCNLRIAPTFPPENELQTAMDILCLCVKLAAARKTLEQKIIKIRD